MTKLLLIVSALLYTSTCSAFFMNIEAERTTDLFSMTASGAIPDAWRKPVFGLKVFSKFTGYRGAACVQPYKPLRTGSGFRFTSPKLNNITLLTQFASVIGCATPLQQQMLALELMYETSDEIDFLKGSVQFHGLDTEDTMLKQCWTTDVAFLAHPNMQDLVIWGLKPRKPYYHEDVHQVPEPGTHFLLATGLIAMAIRRYKRSN